VTTSLPVFVVDEKDNAATPAYQHAQSLAVNEGNGNVQNTSMNTPSHHETMLENSGIHEETSSDRSSVISIPSTQITGLGSSYTGTTTLRGDFTGRNSQESSGRNTLVDMSDEQHDLDRAIRDTRPPSYDACAPRRRADSPGSGSEGGDSVFRHPVMRDGWLEGLRFGTRDSSRG
jgi:hypothetical protein